MRLGSSLLPSNSLSPLSSLTLAIPRHSTAGRLHRSAQSLTPNATPRSPSTTRRHITPSTTDRPLVYYFQTKNGPILRSMMRCLILSCHNWPFVVILLSVEASTDLFTNSQTSHSHKPLSTTSKHYRRTMQMPAVSQADSYTCQTSPRVTLASTSPSNIFPPMLHDAPISLQQTSR